MISLCGFHVVVAVLKVQTPLLRCVVDFLYNKLYEKSTTYLHQIEVMEFA